MADRGRHAQIRCHRKSSNNEHLNHNLIHHRHAFLRFGVVVEFAFLYPFHAMFGDAGKEADAGAGFGVKALAHDANDRARELQHDGAGGVEVGTLQQVIREAHDIAGSQA